MMGATDPLKAEVGTIRGDLAIDIGRNIIHGSDSKESAEREISLYFKAEEILEYSRTMENGSMSNFYPSPSSGTIQIKDSSSSPLFKNWWKLSAGM